MPSQTLIASPSTGLMGKVRVPSDKSLSHRALIIASLSLGETRIGGLLTGDDVQATAAALRQLGVAISPIAQGKPTRVAGVGLGGFRTPTQQLYLGNSGTGARLLAGVIVGSGISAILTGDASLSSRPMQRVIAPLEAMGGRIKARDGDKLPMHIDGTAQPMSLDWVSEVASAQVKSAILLAGLTARGRTTVTEPSQSRDHSETMLAHFGADVETHHHSDGRYTASIMGEAELTAQDISVAADPSSAAFIAVAALICPTSEITLHEVILNPCRFGLYTTLAEMGGDIAITNKRTLGGEEVGDIIVRHSRLKGITVPPDRSATMIDEYPILAVAAAFADGTTHMPNIAELRVKESDRIAAMADGLGRAGVKVTTSDDSMTIIGASTVTGGITVDAKTDHRIAMAHAVLGLASNKPITINGSDSIDTSFPGFVPMLQKLGANLEA